MTSDQKQIQMAYIRVCRDSGFRFDYIKAAHFVAELFGLSPLSIWNAFGSLDTMEAIAAGTHPVVNNPDYDNRKNKVK